MTDAAEVPTTDWLSEPGVQEALEAGALRRTFDPEELAAAVHVLTGAAARLNRAAMGSEVLPWTDLAMLLDAVRAARQEIAAVESNLEVRTAKAMAAEDLKSTELDGVGFVEWRRGSRGKSWEHEQLASAVIDRHMDDRADGELPTPWEVRDWILEAAAPGYWRVTVLRALGIDAGDYSETTPGKLSVQITHPG